MNAANAPPFCFTIAPSPLNTLSTQIPAKRKLGSDDSLLAISELPYPSPPMSAPSSPPPIKSEPFGTVSSAIPSPLSATTTSVALNPPNQLSVSPSILRDRDFAPTLSHQANVYQSAISSASQIPPSEHPSQATPAFAAYNTFPSRASKRTGRKSNHHVASACVNCKRAHLSCDAQRPCTRCIAAGKQDSCYDVQHKKRGRPRLRDDGNLPSSPSVLSEPVSQASSSANTPTTSTTRSIATPRRRRASSLRSQASEGYSGQLTTIPPFSSIHTSHRSILQPPTPSLPASEIPIALLDLDLVILRANGHFQYILADGRDLTGRSLSDIASPADDHSFESIRDRLQTERNARERTSLPPIGPGSQDSLEHVSEADLDRLSKGFEDSTYTWKGKSADQSSEPFSARVRLARSSEYFVSVTLPSFRPMGPPMTHPTTAPQQPYPRSPQTATAQPLLDPTPHASRSTPQPIQPPLTYPSLQLSSILHKAPSRSASRLPPLEPAPNSSNTRRASQGDMLPPTDPGSLQLAPISSVAATHSRPSSVYGSSIGRAPSRMSTTSIEEEESQESPKKKRKVMGIDNVLH